MLFINFPTVVGNVPNYGGENLQWRFWLYRLIETCLLHGRRVEAVTDECDASTVRRPRIDIDCSLSAE